MKKINKYSYVIGIVGLLLLLTGVTYSFFNYTRTGGLNNLGTGTISFNTTEGPALNLTNLFPMTSEEASNANLDSITIDIEGATTYADGEEFVISLVDVNNTVNGKEIPINYIATYVPKENSVIGTSVGEDYWEDRNDKDANIYVLNSTGEVYEDKQVLAGYIDNVGSGISGTLTIKTYIDADRIAITDTYDDGTQKNTVNSNMTQEELNDCATYLSTTWHYANNLNSVTTGSEFCQGTGKLWGNDFQGTIDRNYFYEEELEYLINHGIVIPPRYIGDTTAEWVNGRVVVSTEEWNSLSSTPISFKVRAESNEGIWAEEKLTVNVMNDFPDSIKNKGNKIKEIQFIRLNKSNMETRCSNAYLCEDITYEDEGKVLAFLEANNDANGTYKLFVASDGLTYLTKGEYLFSNLCSTYNNILEVIEFHNVNTERVTAMNSMFRYLRMTAVDLSSFDFSNVTTMMYMFDACNNLVTVNGFQNKDLNAVTTFGYMFRSCYALKNISFEGASTDSLEIANYMFYSCGELVSISLNNLGSDNLFNVVDMFYNCTKLEEINMINFNYGRVDSIFGFISSGCTSLERINLQNAGGDYIQTKGYVDYFRSTIKEINLSNFNIGQMTSFNSLFYNCSVLEEVNLSGIDTSNITDMAQMFYNCSNLTTIYASSGWNTGSVTSSNQMFYNCTSLVGTAPNGTTYPFDSTKIELERALIATNSTPGYLTDISLKQS